MSYYRNQYHRNLGTFFGNVRNKSNACIRYHAHVAFTSHISDKGSPLVGIDRDCRIPFVICLVLEVALHELIKRNVTPDVYDRFSKTTLLPELEWCGHGTISPGNPYSLLGLLSPKERAVVNDYETIETSSHLYSPICPTIRNFFEFQANKMWEMSLAEEISITTMMGWFSYPFSQPHHRFEDYIVVTIRELSEEYAPIPPVYDGIRANTVVSARPKDGVDGIWIFAGVLGAGWGIVSLLWQIPSTHEFGRGFGELWLLLSLTFPWLLMMKSQDCIKDTFVGKFVVFSVGVLFLVLTVIGKVWFDL